jgi:hypothetical protein
MNLSEMLKYILRILSKKRFLVLLALLAGFLLRKQKKRIASKPKSITINSNVLFWNPSTNPANPTIAYKESTIDFIVLLLKQGWAITIINVVKSDAEQEHILKLLQELKKHGLQMERVLFCEQVDSIPTMVRHIEPSLHMDSNLPVIKKISPFVHCYLVRQRAQHFVKKTPIAVKGLTRSVSTRELIPQKVVPEVVIEDEELPNVTRVNSLSDCTFLCEE